MERPRLLARVGCFPNATFFHIDVGRSRAIWFDPSVGRDSAYSFIPLLRVLPKDRGLHSASPGTEMPRERFPSPSSIVADTSCSPNL